MDSLSLDELLLNAHANKDYTALVALYSQAANQCEKSDDFDATCFYLTHAYVFALQEGMNEAKELHRRLAAYGREHPAQQPMKVR